MATAVPPASPLSPRWDPASHQPALSLPQHFGIIALMLYVFVILVRLPEMLSIHFGSSFSVVLIATAVAFLSVLLSGGFRVLTLSPLTAFLVLLHGWFAFTIPFSTWRFGSLTTLRVMGQSAGLYPFVALLVRTERHLRLAVWSVCASTLGVLVYTAVYARFQQDDYARISTGIGRFSNSNDLALFLLMGIPFWLYVMASPRYNSAIRIFAGLEVAASVLQCLRTGSRGALLTLILLSVVLFVMVSVANKTRIALLAVAVTFLATTVVPESVQNRLASVVDDSLDKSAAQSSAGRMMLLRESLEITARHPVFGVGLGVYADAVLGISRAEGHYKAYQQVPHNTFTTISAETGIPGLILYLGCLITALQAVWKARSVASRVPGMEDLSLLSGSIALSWLVFVFNNFLFGLAGDMFFYLTCGLCMAAYVVALKGNQAYQAATAAPQPAATSTGSTATGPGQQPQQQQPEDSESTAYPWLQPAAVSSARRAGFGGRTATPVQPPDPAADDSASQYGDVPWARNPRRQP